MPSIIDGDASIPIAQYGSSNVGRMKTVYRNGLGVRYGRMMQAISGVHYNYSFPETHVGRVARTCVQSRERGQAFISERYFHLLRNYRRHGWLVLYLFGVSPVVCNSLPARAQRHAAAALEGHLVRAVRHFPAHERSRLSQSQPGRACRSRSTASRNTCAISRAPSRTPHAPYEKLGVKVDGEYRQLNANILQIENEYYSFIRPKRVARSGERPTKALLRAGVEYVEVRALDVSAFDPVGVNQNKLRFLEVFLALCLMKDSPPIGIGEQDTLDANHVTVARRGREPGLTLAARRARDADARVGARAARLDAGHRGDLRSRRSGASRIRRRSRCRRPRSTTWR